MKPSSSASLAAAWFSASLGTLLLAALPLRADLVQMQNGDRYAGKVTSLNADTLTIQSDVLGTLKLPRAKVASVQLGSSTLTTSPAPANPTNPPTLGLAATPAPTNTTPELATALRQLSANTNLLQQTPAQLLSGADPAARDKFNELMGGLLSGKLTVQDIRAQAQSAVNQMQTLKQELGPDAGGALDSYLTILEKFLKETGGPSPSIINTNAPDSSAP